jgi:uncharacterized FlaG/YvyC family protein
MVFCNVGAGRYRTNITEVCRRINEYKEQHHGHVIRALTNPYNPLVVKIYDETIEETTEIPYHCVMVVEYLTEKTIDQVTALADIHKDGRFW